MLEAIILAGGLGKRLAKTVPHLPKILAPIQGIPFLELFLLKLQSAHLFSKVIFALGHKADLIENYLEKKKYPFEVAFSIEPSPQGTGGAVLHALKHSLQENLCIFNGDSYSDFLFSDFWVFHKKKGGVATIACREVEDSSRYGRIEFNSEHRILSFSEKMTSPKKGWISRGIYLMKKEFFSSFPLRSYSFEEDFFPLLLGQEIFAYPHSGFFIDIGTEYSYLEAQELLKPWI